MKIERISENQIRCTLTHSDLAERHIELKELAYGSAKARELFHELILAAASEVGFHVENMPLMVEAIPMTMDSIVLIVTRVEDPDELDTRFSRFSPGTEEDWEDLEDASAWPEEMLEGAELLKQLLQKDSASQTAAPSPQSQDGPAQASVPHTDTWARLFAFDSLDSAADAAAALSGSILVHSTLYKDPVGAQYYLCIRCADQEDAFRRTCNTLSEYGTLKPSPAGVLAYCEEHCEILIAARALDRLARLA